MNKYFVKWSFVDRDGVARKGGELIELDEEYAMILIGKGLITSKQPKKQAAPENKATEPAENKAPKKTAKK